MKCMPKLSLETCPREYFDWQDAMENFFEGRGFQSVVKMYYAEETFDKDVLLWWLHLLLKGAVLDQTVMHESGNLSSTLGLHVSDSSCDIQSDHKIDDTNDASDGLSMMAWEVHSDDTPVDVKGQRSNIFQTACKIQDKVRMQLLALLNVIGTYGNFDGNSSDVSACTIKYDFTMLSETTIKASKVALESEAG
uniref:Uncharacterized protein n=1 Tax=Oryza meridionalis TaxID=40149 RepID=A0A0E0F659_9ORYZ